MKHRLVANDRLEYLGLRAKRDRLTDEGPGYDVATLPGEFSRDEILSVAAAAFDVDPSQLAQTLLTTSSSQPAFEPDLAASVAALSELTNGATLTQFEALACALASAMVPAMLSSQLALARAASVESGIDLDVVTAYVTQTMREEVTSVCSDLLVFEINAARSHELITTSDSTEAAGELRVLLDDPGYLAYLETKYPMLRARLSNRIALVAQSTATTVERISLHLPDITDHFGDEGRNGRDAWVVSAIQASSGDSHNGASHVTFVRFSNGKTVVYKPRTTQGEERFQRYLAQLERWDPSLSFRKMAVLNCTGYGWTEFMQRQDAKDEQAIRDYYFRYGALLAALDTIAGTDIHFENLVAVGAHPVIIDLETILQPTEVEGIEEGKTRGLLSLDYYHDTPLITAMFDPSFVMGSLNGSPLSTPLDMPSGAICLKFEDEKFVLGRGANKKETSYLPTIDGTPITFQDYADDIVAGFRQVSYLILSHRQELLSGVLKDLFGGIRVRSIFRYTRQYLSVVRAVNSAYALQGLRNSEELLSKLWRAVSVTPGLTSVIAAEHFDVWNGDVPYFECTVESKAAISSQNHVIDRIFSKSGWDVTVSRILAKDRGRIEKEIGLLEFCLHAKVKDIARAKANGRDELPSSDLPADPGEMLQAIQRRFLIRDGRPLIMDIVALRTLKSRQSLAGYDFYNGMPGICFALAYGDTDSLNGNPSQDLRALCDATLSSNDWESMLETGACYGVGSGIYLAAHLSALWRDPYFQALGEHLAAHAARIAYTDRHFDVFGGSAGLLRALLALRKSGQTTKLDGTIEFVVDHLLQNGQRHDGSLTWLSSIPSTGPTTGYAHGVSGIADALLAAGTELGLQRAVDGAVAAERFLAACRADNGGWRECQMDANSSSIEVWCHGSPGIALFYQSLARIVPTPEILQAAAGAMEATNRFAMFENDSMCHGSLGNIEALLNQEAHGGTRSPMIDAVIDALKDRPIRCGNERQYLNLGIFNGASGIAYQQLRARSPSRFPSVLTFAPPVA